MSKLENITALMNYVLNHAMKTLDQSIALIPDNQLIFKPEAKLEVMPLADLAYHIYNMAYMNMKGSLEGKFTDEEDFGDFLLDWRTFNSSEEILAYGNKVKAFMRENLPKLTEEDLERKITYSFPQLRWPTFEITGFNSLATIHEEVVHHRAQIALYLRIMGIKPPFIYDVAV